MFQLPVFILEKKKKKKKEASGVVIDKKKFLGLNLGQMVDLKQQLFVSNR